jgi:hypothetical protein
MVKYVLGRLTVNSKASVIPGKTKVVARFRGMRVRWDGGSSPAHPQLREGVPAAGAQQVIRYYAEEGMWDMIASMLNTESAATWAHLRSRASRKVQLGWLFGDWPSISPACAGVGNVWLSYVVEKMANRVWFDAISNFRHLTWGLLRRLCVGAEDTVQTMVRVCSDMIYG